MGTVSRAAKKKRKSYKMPGFTLFATRRSLFRDFLGRLQVKCRLMWLCCSRLMMGAANAEMLQAYWNIGG
ncbi:MAG: hypothetical protein J6A01_00385, partial [Proteobacteria bacterium]|nr:hypothetical protein [Pseudomonadota bacterium]